jgi:hypothetical protein
MIASLSREANPCFSPNRYASMTASSVIQAAHNVDRKDRAARTINEYLAPNPVRPARHHTVAIRTPCVASGGRTYDDW